MLILILAELNVADINLGKVIVSKPHRVHSFAVNAFSKSPVITALTYQTIQIFDRDLNLVQKGIFGGLQWPKSIFAVDETEYVIGTFDGFAVIDTRFLGDKALFKKKFPPSGNVSLPKKLKKRSPY